MRGAVEVFELDLLCGQAVADDGQHGCELAEDKDLVAGVERFQQELVQEFELGRGDAGALAVREEFRRAADLPHAHDRGEQMDARDAMRGGVRLAELTILLHGAVLVLAVEFALRRLHVAVEQLFLLGRQFEADVGLTAAEHERRDAAHELALELGVRLDLRELVAEGIERAEEPRMQEVEHAPEVFGGIFERGAGQDELVRGWDGLAGARVEAERVLDVLRLVQNQRGPPDRADLFDVAADERVGGYCTGKRSSRVKLSSRGIWK